LSSIEAGIEGHAKDRWRTVEKSTCTEAKREKENGPWCAGETPYTTTQKINSECLLVLFAFPSTPIFFNVSKV
jgi:hypothetical protein